MSFYTMRRSFGGKDHKLYGSYQGTKIPSSSIEGQAKDDEKTILRI